MPRLLYVKPRMYLLGYGLADATLSYLLSVRLLSSGLADASPTLLDASHVLAWLWLG